MNCNVIGVGEVLWDLLQTGPQMGGAPANFAYHAHALGAKSQVITRIGNDDLGCEIIRRFQAMALPRNTVQVDAVAPTGTATVSLSGDGLAHFSIQDNVAWDFLAATPEALAAARQADAICFGSLAQRSQTSRNTIQQLIAAAPAQALRVFDINLRQHYYSRDLIEHSLHLANVLKLNDDELPALAAMFNLAGSCGADTLVRTEDPRHTNIRSNAWRVHSACKLSRSRVGRMAVCSTNRRMVSSAGPIARPVPCRWWIPSALAIPSLPRWFWDCSKRWTWTKSTVWPTKWPATSARNLERLRPCRKSMPRDSKCRRCAAMSRAQMSNERL